MSKLKIYKASAGSGKTYTLALEYIRELLSSYKQDAYRNILAVTFTKDATGEMKDRILAELYGLAFHTADSQGFLQSLQKKLTAENHDWDEKRIREKAGFVLNAVLHDYSRLNITTIDSFFQKVLRNLARELGAGSKFGLEMNTEKVLSEAVHATIEKANQNKQILEWLTTYIEHRMDEAHNWRIEQEIFQFSRCIYNEFFQENELVLRRQIEANPHLFRDLKQQQNQIKIECKTFFVNILLKIQSLLDAHQLSADDFIRKGLPIAFFQKLAAGDFSANVSATILNCASDATAWTTKSHARRMDIQNLAENDLIPLLQETLQMQIRMLTSQLITENLHQLGLVWDITKEIELQNAENNRFMLSDTARFLNEMIDGSDAPFIYEKIGADIQHVMIDEFQDTSRLQWQNFKSLLSNIIADNHFSLIVGDVKQAIYRWRNGDWRILNRIEQELPAKIEHLDTNFRSHKRIVEFNNAFFLSAAEKLNQLYINKLNTTSDSPFLSAYSAKNLVQHAHKQEESGFVSIDFIENDSEEMTSADAMKQAVFQKIQELYAHQIPVREICILTRKNNEIIALADYLASLKNDFPEMAAQHYLDILSDEAFQLKSSPAIKILIEALKIVVDPENAISQTQLNSLLSPFSILDSRFLILHLNKMPLFELIGYLYRHLKLEKIEGQSAYLFAFYDALKQYLNEKPADLPQFLQYWDDELQIRTIPTGANATGIRAMTVHKSKGLQFSTVIVPYCDWKINPQFAPALWCGAKEGLYDVALLPVNYVSSMANTVFAPEYMEETVQSWMDTLNLLYVAFTRAERNLLIIGTFKKNLSEDKISTASGLLQLSFSDLKENNDEDTHHFEIGHLLPSASAVGQKNQDNPLKQNPQIKAAHFISNEFQAGKSIFKQSNQSREFVSGESGKKEKYVAYGNIMHALFEQISHFDAIEKAIDNLIVQGLIQPQEKENYVGKIREAIEESNVNDWFDGTYKSYQEHSIIMEENGEVVSKRPDRVLLSDDKTLIIDYKFGQAHKNHQKQVRQYMDLLESMHYPQVEGYLWYVEERRVESAN
ncbi:DNA helicase [Bacteroidia bacterium]|nr:DNA helicase [Bacteroidia bacterium]